MKNSEYTLGDALMAERNNQVKWAIRQKLKKLYNLLDVKGFENHYVVVMNGEQLEKAIENIQDILNLVENEL